MHIICTTRIRCDAGAGQGLPPVYSSIYPPHSRGSRHEAAVWWGRRGGGRRRKVLSPLPAPAHTRTPHAIRDAGSLSLSLPFSLSLSLPFSLSPSLPFSLPSSLPFSLSLPPLLSLSGYTIVPGGRERETARPALAPMRGRSGQCNFY